MLPNDAPCGGLEGFRMRVTVTDVWWYKWEKSLKMFVGHSISSHQCIVVGER